ncbi:MAG TPA: MerR family transcriptional regulator [Thermoleophilaceae bacterium]|jgi:DNA-binding transcriptional MerR regulator|nr:MerR family transcriptional regulator [Thermoleophilaceae bacterium]
MGLTIQEAAETTGWSARMLRYLGTVGLIEPPRNEAGYRIYGAEELQRLRTLRELLDRHGLGPSDVAFAKRMRDDAELQAAVARWLEEKPLKPEDIRASDWLEYEQRKHQKLLAA